MKFDWQNIGIKELSAIVSSHLQKNGIEVVLVGGGCVSIYSDNQYMSNDIDLITFSSIKEITPILAEIGFKNTGGRLFDNPHCKFILDFPAPPVSIGDGPVSKFNNIITSFGSVCLLTPEDCIKDRLAAFFFWNDQQSLDQAVLVVKRNKINFSEIKKWAKVQDELKKYNIFLKKCTEKSI